MSYQIDNFDNIIELEGNKKEVYNLANELLNDVRGTDTRTHFIQETLKGNFNLTELENIKNNEPEVAEDLQNIFDTAQKIDPDELKEIYNQLIGIDTYENIEEQKKFTSKELLAEVCDNPEEEIG